MLSVSILFCRRADRKPDKNLRVCGCHFPNGKENGPCLFEWFKTTPSHPTLPSKQSLDHPYCKVGGKESAVDPNGGAMEEPEDVVRQESRPVKRKVDGAIYSPAALTDEVIRMETR